MNQMQLIALALRQLRQRLRQGETLIILCAMVLAVTITSVCASLSDNIQQVLYQQAAARLGGDVKISSSRRLDDTLWQTPQANALHNSQAITFPSMAMDQSQQHFLLAALKLVDANYPLRGQLELETAQGLRQVQQGPDRGEVWVDRNVLQRLDAQLGDSLHLGERQFTISAILLKEPDSFSFFSALSARILLNQQDLDSLGLLQTGSRVRYHYMFSGTPNAVTQFAETIQPQLPDYASLKQVDQDSNERLHNIAAQVRYFLNLVNLFSVFFAMAAILMALQRYQSRQQTLLGVMRCYGISQQRLLWLNAIQLGSLGLLACVIASLFALLLSQLASHYIEQHFQLHLSGLSTLPIVQGILSGMLLLLSFGLLPLRQQLQQPVLHILKNNATAITSWRLRLIYLLIMLCVFLLLLGPHLSSLVLLSSFALLLLLCYYTLPTLLKLTQRLLPRSYLWYASFQRLRFYRQASFIQCSALLFVLYAMLVLGLLSGQLLHNWQRYQQQQLPNHFAINIQPGEQTALQQQLQQQSVETQPFYPMVRGRLTQINQTPVKQLFPDEQRRPNAVKRELNLTWATQLPSDNRILQGEWWSDNPTLSGISIEQSLAEKLGVTLGDQLGFDIAGETLQAPVTSIRSVDWQSFQPNFYIIFSQGWLEALPHQYITSFYLPQDNDTLARQLVQQFPAMSLFDIGFIIQQLQQVIQQLAWLVQWLLGFIVLCGLLVIIASLYSSLPQRQHDAAILRALGARRTQLHRYWYYEMGGLGLMIGGSAMLLAEITCLILQQRWFKLPFEWHYALWLCIPIATALLLICCAGWMNRPLLRSRAIALLRHSS